MLKIHDLTVNGQVQPLGIAADPLRLGWKLLSDRDGTSQASYRIVADRLGSTVWDSGVAPSDASVAVRWAGAPLASRDRIAWRVFITDNHGQLASAASTFEIGLLGADEWRARFIEHADVQDPAARHPATLFRRSFRLDKAVVRARLYITAHGCYEASVNGQPVSDALFTPGFTVYDRRLQFQTYDVTGLLRPGSNAIGAQITDAWYRGVHGPIPLTNSFGTQLALLAQLEILFDDGSEMVVATDEHWRCGQGAVRFADLHQGMIVDLREHDERWDRPDADESCWRPVRCVAHDLRRLCPQDGPFTRTIEMRTATEILRTPDGSTVVDFGQNLAGHVQLSATGERGHEIELLPVETLDQHGNPYAGTTVMPDDIGVFKYLLGLHKFPIRHHVWRFTLSGRPAERLSSRQVYSGFRYVVVKGWPGKLQLSDIAACVVQSDLAPTGRFECSDPRINRLQENIRWSLRGNLVEVPTDCPAREKGGYTGDLLGVVKTAAFNFDLYEMIRRWIKDVAADQEKLGDEGIVRIAAPTTKCYDRASWFDGSAGWAEAVVGVPWALYWATGNDAVLEQAWPAMLRWMAFADRRARKFGRAAWFVPRRLFSPSHWRRNKALVTKGFHFGDWLKPDETINQSQFKNMVIPPVLEATALYAMSLGLMASIADVLGKPVERRAFSERHAEVVRAWQEEFMTRDGRLTIDRQHAYVLALAFDLIPEEWRQAAADRLAELVRRNGNRLNTGFLSTPHLLPVLSRYGHHGVAADLLMQDRPPSWLYEVDRGATTMWEAWDCVRQDGRVSSMSQNHYCFGSVGQWLYENLGGLDALAPGQKRLRVSPLPACGVTTCTVERLTPYGTARSSWRIEGDQFRLEVAIPPGTTAEVRLPDGTSTDVESGSHVFEAKIVLNPSRP